jgi:hypothetical protein
VQDLDRQILALLPEQRLGLLGGNDTRTVMRIDDVVPNLEIAVEILEFETNLGLVGVN